MMMRFSSYKRIFFIVSLLVLLFSLADFGLYLSHYLFIATFMFFLVFFGLILYSGQSVSLLFFVYALLVVIFSLINHLFSPNFNFLLLTPLFAFVVFYDMRAITLDLKKLFDIVIKTFVVLIFLVAIFEIFVKLTGYDSFRYADFIKEYGDRRFDVLRVRTLFGSSLSTAALSIFFVIYFSFFFRSKFFLLLSFVIILLSGSRTAIVILFFIIAFLFTKSLYQGCLSKGSLLIAGLGVVTTFAVVVFTPAGRIAVRSLSVKMDDSFTGRSNTTVQTLMDLFDQLPYSLFIGLQNSWVSDSAITSIMAGSGIFIFIFFILLWIFLLIKTNLVLYSKILIFLSFILGAAMIGDFFVPVVSFLYFLTFLIYGRNRVADFERNYPHNHGS